MCDFLCGSGRKWTRNKKDAVQKKNQQQQPPTEEKHTKFGIGYMSVMWLIFNVQWTVIIFVCWLIFVFIHLFLATIHSGTQSLNYLDRFVPLMTMMRETEIKLLKRNKIRTFPWHTHTHTKAINRTIGIWRPYSRPHKTKPNKKTNRIMERNNM